MSVSSINLNGRLIPIDDECYIVSSSCVSPGDDVYKIGFPVSHIGVVCIVFAQTLDDALESIGEYLEDASPEHTVPRVLLVADEDVPNPYDDGEEYEAFCEEHYALNGGAAWMTAPSIAWKLRQDGTWGGL